MQTLSATCLAIALADKAGTLRINECESRLGSFYAIEDARGLIEVALTRAEVNVRLASVREMAA